MDCPRCNAELETRGGGLDAYLCPDGHGRFVDSADVEDFLRRHQIDRTLLADLVQPAPSGNAARCPQCASRMHRARLKGDELDFCRGCGGLWADRGELSLGVPLKAPPPHQEGPLNGIMPDSWQLLPPPERLPLILRELRHSFLDWRVKRAGQSRVVAKKDEWKLPGTVGTVAAIGLTAVVLTQVRTDAVFFLAFGYAVVAVGAALLGSREAVMDLSKKKVTIRRRSLLGFRKKEIPFDDIEGVGVNTDQKEGGTGAPQIHRLELWTHDGTHHPISDWETDNKRLRLVAQALNTALDMGRSH
jgi:Zn-finger nucleic acid-binding protein